MYSQSKFKHGRHKSSAQSKRLPTYEISAAKLSPTTRRETIFSSEIHSVDYQQQQRETNVDDEVEEGQQEGEGGTYDLIEGGFCPPPLH